MFATSFDYQKPTTVNDAIQILSNNNEAKVLAGGQSLIPLLKLRLARPTVVVDDITEDLPREVTATVELLPGHSPQIVVAANLAKFPRFIKLASSVVGLVRGVEVHGDRVYQDYGEGGTVAFVENTIIWTGKGTVLLFQ